MFDPDTGEKLTKKINRMHLVDSDTVDTSVITCIKQGRDGITINMVDKLKCWENLKEIFEWKVQKNKEEKQDNTLKMNIIKSKNEKDANIYHHWSAPRWDKIYRTELLKTVVSEMGDNLPKTGEDLLMNLYYLQHCKKVSSIGNAYCYNYRVLDQSLARGYRPQLEEENRKYMTAVVELACKTNRSFHAKSVMEDNNILNLLYELKHTPDMTDAEKKQISKRLKTQLHDQKKAWKLLLYEDFPGKKALRELKHKLTSQ